MSTRYQLHRYNGREVETVKGLSLKVATLQQERDRWSGTRSIIVPEPGRKSGRIER